MLLQIPLTLSKRLSYFGMYTANTRLLTKFKSAFLNLLIVTKKLVNLYIAELINETLRKNGIHVPLADCRGQGYDNGSNMSGSYNVSQEDHFRNNVFYVLLDCVIGNMTNRYESIHALESMFGFLWKYLNMNEREVEVNAKIFVAQHAGDVSSELVQEIMHLKAIHTSNLGEKPLNPIQLLNALAETSLMVIFPNCCVALRICCALPVTVAEAERSFSVLKRIKNYLRSTMCQMRLTSLGTLAVGEATRF